MRSGLQTQKARAAYDWLMGNNATYRRWVEKQEQVLDSKARDDTVSLYIPTAELLLRSPGVEVACRPILYPCAAYGDSDMKERLVGTYLEGNAVPLARRHYLQKAMGMCLGYAADPLVAFLIHDISLATSIMGKLHVADRRGLGAECLADNSQRQEGFWLHEQDLLCDVVRQMRQRCLDQEGHPELYRYCRLQKKLLGHPNVFITIAPAEWRFPLHEPLFRGWKEPDGQGMKQNEDLSYVQGLLTLHVYNVLMALIPSMLADSSLFAGVLEHVIRVEFQGRGTLHVHIALWAMLHPDVDLRGRTGVSHDSPLIRFLEKHGFDTVDVQYGEGFVNYINGYTAKASDSLVFRLSEHVRGEDSKWRQTYRMLCKSSPCIPEVFSYFASLPMMQRSFYHDVLYAPIQRSALDLDRNVSLRLYGTYLKSVCVGGCALGVVKQNFLQYVRMWRYDGGPAGRVARRSDKMTAVGVRFSFELQDNFIGQYCAMFFPHTSPEEFLAQGQEVLEYTKFFVGAMIYLSGLRWYLDEDSDSLLVVGRNGAKYALASFPRDLPQAFGMSELNGQSVFQGRGEVYSNQAFEYLALCIEEELQTRIGSGRRRTFLHRLNALGLLYHYISQVPAHDRPRQVEEWNRVHGGLLQERQWSEGQRRALDWVRECTNRSDESRRCLDESVGGPRGTAGRCLYLAGRPGSGKSEVLVHAAVEAAQEGCRVMILCPTGALVHSYRDRLPVHENIQVETLHSGFRIGRDVDLEVGYAPPSRLRHFDVFLLDEGSQVEDHVTRKVMMGLLELPQEPTLVVAADFQQLNPVKGGGLMKAWVSDPGSFQCIDLETIFRTEDNRLLSFLSTIRERQPEKGLVEDFFRGRRWTGSLSRAVGHGLDLTEETGELFMWLCVTNKGADRVNKAALKHLGVDVEELPRIFAGV